MTQEYSLEEILNIYLERIYKLEAQLQGAEKRALMLLETKDRWADRTRELEKKIAAVQEMLRAYYAAHNPNFNCACYCVTCQRMNEMDTMI